MKTLYLECNMGAAGDMLSAALLELHPDPDGFLARVNALGLPGVRVERQKAVKCGICGTQMRVTVNGAEEQSADIGGDDGHAHSHDHHHDHAHGHDDAHGHDHGQEHAQHHHAGLDEIERLIASLALPDGVKADALAVYRLIAEAESHAHGRPVGQIHFHEVGTLDAVADVTAFCLLLHEIAPERVLASPVHVGAGQVRCAHGVLPVPAPATAHILRGVPIYGGTVQGELCTPTGAALLRHFAASFGPMPVMRVSQIGYGCGKKDFAQANCVRALLGETEEDYGEICELCCNLDDMTPEAVAFAAEELFARGALDVYTTAIQMKKNRPGVLLTCMCRAEQRGEMLETLFRHTSTLGVREYHCGRYALSREMRTVQTAHGTVQVKTASGFGVRREKAEYEDLARIARAQGISLAEAAALAAQSM